MNALYITGFLLGIASNLHCLGMCGPIALAIPLKRDSNLALFSGILQYNAGRIAIYASLGLLIGMIGLSVNTFGIMQWISLASGAVMIIYAWNKQLLHMISAKLPNTPSIGFTSSAMARIMKKQSFVKLFILGSLNGLLPCGMVYLALLNALTAKNPIESTMAMAFFGMGTLPALLVVSFSAHKINPFFREKFKKIVPVFITILGVLVILRGSNLNIPYLSPSVSVVVHKNAGKKKVDVELGCCHKPKRSVEASND